MKTLRPIIQLAFFAIMVVRAQGHWLTQTNIIKPGWNAVYLHVDGSHITLDNLVTGANPITEIWMWQPDASTAQFTTSPQAPTTASSQWLVWNKAVDGIDTLLRLRANAAYLVRSTAAANYSWVVQGKAAAPKYTWSTEGLNFIGFPTPYPTTGGASPDFETFLTPAPEFQRLLEVFRYPGGEAAGNEPAPVKVFPVVFRNTPAVRGEAFWMRAGTKANDYYGPIEVSLQNPNEIHFGEELGTFSIRLKNKTTTARTMTLNILASATPPAGQQAISGSPPLLMRGNLNLATLTYAHTQISGAQTVTLAPAGQPGSDMEVVLGLNRSAMNAAAGSLYAGILRCTDNSGLEQIDLPVTATVPDISGLWVGTATLMQVGQYLKTYQRDANGQPILGPITDAGAPFQVSGVNQDLTTVPSPLSMRIILHHDRVTGETRLLQRVMLGLRNGAASIVTREELLDASTLSDARRISAPHLPYSNDNINWLSTSGQFGTGLSFSVLTGYNDHAANPFLHTFHPDHDNLKADFTTVDAPGKESYSVSRAIQFSFTPPNPDFAGLTASKQSLGGVYTETITIQGSPAQSRQFITRGNFKLTRLSPVRPLTQN